MMRRFHKGLIITLTILVFLPAFSLGQDSESFLEQFQRNLMDSFIGHMRAERKEVTNRMRAKFMGYILNRQTQYNEDFEMDEVRMQSLVSEVREFLKVISTQEDLWPIVEAGLRGEFRQEVEAMLGGSPYVEPMFPSLQATVDKWKDLEYSLDRYSMYPGSEAILEVALTCLQLLREKRYQDVKGLLAGRTLERYSNVFSAILNSPQQSEQYNEYFEKLEWKVGQAGMSDTEPPMVRIMFEIPDLDGEWQEVPFVLILDNSRWKIARFI